jgi:CRP/FNR family transcriptional regulator, cyclic AMP receptor protein
MNAQTELLNGLSEEEAGQVLSLGDRMTMTGGAQLFHMGDAADHLYLVTRGRIKLTLPMQVRGQEQEVMVEERYPGQAVGWSALTPPYQFTLTATAMVQSEVLAISRDALRRHFEACPAVGYAVSLNLAAVIGQRLQLFQAMWLREMERMVELRCA